MPRPTIKSTRPGRPQRSPVYNLLLVLLVLGIFGIAGYVIYDKFGPGPTDPNVIQPRIVRALDALLGQQPFSMGISPDGKEIPMATRVVQFRFTNLKDGQPRPAAYEFTASMQRLDNNEVFGKVTGTYVTFTRYLSAILDNGDRETRKCEVTRP